MNEWINYLLDGENPFVWLGGRDGENFPCSIKMVILMLRNFHFN